jgi:hypothetical protein
MRSGKIRQRRTSYARGGQVTPEAHKLRQRRTSPPEADQRQQPTTTYKTPPEADKTAEGALPFIAYGRLCLEYPASYGDGEIFTWLLIMRSKTEGVILLYQYKFLMLLKIKLYRKIRCKSWGRTIFEIFLYIRCS